MKFTYKSDIRINGERDELLALFGQDRFSQKYFPEIRKQISGLSNYVAGTHNNLHEILPSYMVPCFGMGWTEEAGMVFEVPNKTLSIDIQAIEIEHVRRNGKSILSIEVSFDAELSLGGLTAAYYVQRMVKSRLKAIKRDVEARLGNRRTQPLIQCGLEY